MLFFNARPQTASSIRRVNQVDLPEAFSLR
jgi:hypothetical protein